MSSEQVSTGVLASSDGGRRAGVLGAAALGLDLADSAILGTTRDVHEAVLGRVHAVGDKISGHRTALHATHSGATTLIYTGIGHGLRASARGLRAADARLTRSGVLRPLEDSPGGRFAVSALNGLFGDRIHRDSPELAITMALRRRGADVVPDAAGLAAAYPDATPAVVVFVHGLGETEDVWRLRSEERGGSYGSRLRDEHGWSPVYVRVNTGLTLAENGVAMAALLDDLVAHWPVEVTRIAIVGHSMGGLVARAACAVRTDAERAWTRVLTDMVSLGVPHLGAPIARALTAGSGVLGLLPESAPFGRFLDHRSAGILDLRQGLPDDVRALPHVRHRLVAATLTSSPRHPVAEVVGDLLVRYPSALGRARRGRQMFPDADVVHVPNAHHFDLLNHPDVDAALRRWLAGTA